MANRQRRIVYSGNADLKRQEFPREAQREPPTYNSFCVPAAARDVYGCRKYVSRRAVHVLHSVAAAHAAPGGDRAQRQRLRFPRAAVPRSFCSASHRARSAAHGGSGQHLLAERAVCATLCNTPGKSLWRSRFFAISLRPSASIEPHLCRRYGRTRQLASTAAPALRVKRRRPLLPQQVPHSAASPHPSA